MKATELFDVSGLAVIVTGAASGIGLAYAEAMADNGARVTLLDINAAELEKEEKRLSRTADVRSAVVDVTDREALRAAVDAAAAYYGGLDVVFANAGISPGPGFLQGDDELNPDGFIENVSDDVWDKILAVNLSGVFNTIKAAVPHLKARGGGRIIVTTSIGAFSPEGLVSTPYMPSKGGVLMLVKQAALELGKYNIRVNAIAPAAFLTSTRGKDPAVRARFSNKGPLPRAALTDEIQGAALYLASPASSFVNGTQLVVDGGRTLGKPRMQRPRLSGGDAPASR